ncbi:antiviral innate immune response receptor RIG-I-like isoform X2 [Physella acuta]|uniref:antiviral innate immune response receptor RIG-I-like isoform X2 n=1 Tax=Physella acuta TaxID=109671 RepID=UPI0027DB9FFE|nr:antiviral innate immune response receptor RIG-I-like isoform X2 [Physella acuta]
MEPTNWGTEIVVEFLRDTFVKYLQPEYIKQKSCIIEKNSEEIFLSKLSDREKSVEELFVWLLDSETYKDNINHFIAALKDFAADPDSCVLVEKKVNGPNELKAAPVCYYLSSIIDLIDGSLLQKIKQEDLYHVLDDMHSNNIINGTAHKRCKARCDTSESLMELIKCNKTEKSDWPFFFINSLVQNQPGLFNLSCCNKHQFCCEFESYEPKRYSKPKSVASDFSSISAASNKHSTTPKECSTTAASLSSHHGGQFDIPESEVSREFSDAKRISENYYKVELTAAELNKPITKRILKNKVIDSRHIEEVKDNYMSYGESACCSDENDDEDKKSTYSADKENRVVPLSTDSAVLKTHRPPPSVKTSCFSSVPGDSAPQLQGLEFDSTEEILEDTYDILTDGEELPAIRKSINYQDLVLRNYQEELAEKALEGFNTVICAPTGSGKTLVAAYIIFEHLKKGTSDTNSKIRVAFLARTVPLATQQYKFLNGYLPKAYKIELITGRSNDTMSLKSILKDNNVIVMTPMILQNNIKNKHFRLSKFTLLVFDECHHTRKDEPYNEVMFSYISIKVRGTEKQRNHLPQIVGLTASIGVEKAVVEKQAVESVKSVMANLDSPYLSTVKRFLQELQSVVPVPFERYELLEELDTDGCAVKVYDIIAKLEQHIKNHALELKNEKITRLVNDIPSNKKSQGYCQWIVKLNKTAMAVPITDPDRETNMDVRSIIIITHYLKHYNFALETHDLVELRDVMAYLENCFKDFQRFPQNPSEEKIFYGYFQNLKAVVAKRQDVENPNLLVLARTLEEYLLTKGENSEKSRGIIFVRTRALAEAVVSWIKRGEMKFLNPSVFTGTNASEEQGGMSQLQQQNAIEKFASGEVRLLVATSVAEEGLDIPECNLVIKYNHVGNEVTTVQTRGRSRKQGGVSVLLATQSILNREKNNQERMKLMNKAIKAIAEMKESDIIEFINTYQLKVIEEAEIEEELKKKRKVESKSEVFKMVCSRCRKVGVNNTKLRTIFEKYRISIDRDLVNSGKIKIVERRSGQIMDEIEFLGPVYCQGEPNSGKVCGNPLGQMIKYEKVHYFAVGIKNFGFYLGDNQDLRLFKKWKQVPYVIEELTLDDTKNYLLEREDNFTNDISDDSDSSDSDDGSNQGAYAPPIKKHTLNVEASLVEDAVHITQVKTVYSNTEIHFAKSINRPENEAPQGFQDCFDTSTLSSISGPIHLLDSSSSIATAEYSSESTNLSEHF